MWSVINLPDIIALIKHFTQLDFSNITVDICHSSNPTWDNTPVLTIDRLVHINYIHTKFGKGSPYKLNGNLYVENPLIEVHQTYLRRLHRMKTLSEPPTFIINQSNAEEYTAAGIKRLLTEIANTPYETHIICPQQTQQSGIYGKIYVHNIAYCCKPGLDKKSLSKSIMDNVFPISA